MFMHKMEPKTSATELTQRGDFATVRKNILQMQDNWNTFYKEFSRIDSPHTAEFRQHNQHFSQAVDKILTALETPTLTLATTGTTSSGKSTLVNLLCGADIMPRMAGEMSAGIVTIKHASDGKRLLKIEKITNAVWECGEWKDLSDYDIRDRLTKTMDAFNKAKETRELPSPVIELTYPVACFFPNAGLLNLSDLPARTQFQIMDLPGKRNQDDKINSAVIQNCRRALSIVTYDMGQTDEKLRQKLIEEVLDQVKLMGGSPARMLFALNRIDVFRKDPEWERREQESAEKTIKEIKHILHERLPEHRGVLEHLSYSKLSSLPALRAWQMQSNQKDLQEYASEQIDEHFKFLIPRAVKINLSNNSCYHWNENDFLKVRNSLWESTYAKDFFSMLEKHIRENFAKLITAPLLVEFEGVVARIIDQVNNTCTVEIESSYKNLDKLKAQLKQDKETIKNILANHHDNLMSLPRFIEKNPENLDLLYHASEQLGDLYKHDYIKGDILPAFSKAVIEPIQWISGVVEGTAQSLKSNTLNYTDTTADELPHKQRRKLDFICRSLLNEVYNDHVYNDVDSYTKIGDSSCYGHGYHAKAVDDDEKIKIRRIQKIFEQRLNELSSLIQDIYDERVHQEASRIKYFIEEILKIFIERLNRAIKYKGFTLSINFDESIYSDVQLDIDSIEFNPSIDIETRKEGNPWLLWLSKRDVDYLEIPTADDLHGMINQHLQGLKTIATKPLQEAIEKYYDEVNEKMEDYLSSIMDDVNAKLTTKLNSGQERQQEEELKWQKLRSSVTIINKQMQQLHNYKA